MASRDSLLLIGCFSPQLSAAVRELRERGLPERVIALAKREETVYVPGRSAPLSVPAPTLSLLTRQRDEAHAAALLSHRMLRATQLSSSLDGCSLAPPEQAAIRAAFGSSAALCRATPQQLASVLGSRAAAAALHSHLRRSHLHSSQPHSSHPLLPHHKDPLDIAARLEGHESAVSALALSASELGGEGVGGEEFHVDWRAEERARRWWDDRRRLRLDQLQRDPSWGHAVASALEASRELLSGRTSSAEALEHALATTHAHRFRPASAPTSSRPTETVETAGTVRLGERSEGRAGRRRSLAREGRFELVAPYAASDAQAAVVGELVGRLEVGEGRVLLKGGTGTGKTFVMASVIEALNKPALLIAPNKVLAAQLCSELKGSPINPNTKPNPSPSPS